MRKNSKILEQTVVNLTFEKSLGFHNLLFYPAKIVFIFLSGRVPTGSPPAHCPYQ